MTPSPHRGGFVYRGEIALGVGVDSTTFTLNKKTPRVKERSFTSLARLSPEYEEYEDCDNCLGSTELELPRA